MNILSTPLYYVRSGDIVIEFGTLRGAGTDGYGWTRFTHPDSYAYFLNFYTINVYPTDGYGVRYFAFPVRAEKAPHFSRGKKTSSKLFLSAIGKRRSYLGASARKRRAADQAVLQWGKVISDEI